MQRPTTDDQLLNLMFAADPAVARIAKRIFDERHAGDPPPREPAHCAQCFEGCPKCQPQQFTGSRATTFK